MNLFTRFIREDEGQNLIEYALLAGLIALACVVAVGAAGTEMQALYDRIKTELQSIPGPAGS